MVVGITGERVRRGAGSKYFEMVLESLSTAPLRAVRSAPQSLASASVGLSDAQALELRNLTNNILINTRPATPPPLPPLPYLFFPVISLRATTFTLFGISEFAG